MHGDAVDLRLADFYFDDPRLVLVPIEHLTRAGMSRAFADLVAERRGWNADRRALFDAAFTRYWARSDALAGRTRTWPAPRLRHVAVVEDATAVRPYVQLLNTSAWMLYACDLDPERSHAELAAYLLVLGDRMALSGEVASAPLHAAAYWFERDAEEVAAFAAAAARSPRPDAAMLVAVAEAVPWLRELAHETVRPAASSAPRLAIPGTGLLVPRALVAEPPALVERTRTAAASALAAFHARWRGADRPAVTSLADWLAGAAPRLLVTADRGRIVWDPDAPARVGPLVHALRDADGVAVTAIADDLRVVHERTAEFHGAVVDPGALPPPGPATEQSGYSYLHRERGLIAYNLHETGMERLTGPALPYARAMLAARTLHEWAHLAADAGWVPVVDERTHAAALTAFVTEMRAAIAAAPAAVLGTTAADLRTLGSPTVFADVLLARMADYQANLVAARFLRSGELETYVRHNVRSLRHEYEPARLWRMLVRHLYEYQYLRFSDVEDRRKFFLASTWFDHDFLESGILDEARFDRLTSQVAALCSCYAVDERRFR